MNVPPAVLDRIKKLRDKAADVCNPNESASAQRFLDDLLLKYGILAADLEPEVQPYFQDVVFEKGLSSVPVWARRLGNELSEFTQCIFLIHRSGIRFVGDEINVVRVLKAFSLLRSEINSLATNSMNRESESWPITRSPSSSRVWKNNYCLGFVTSFTSRLKPPTTVTTEVDEDEDSDVSVPTPDSKEVRTPIEFVGLLSDRPVFPVLVPTRSQESLMDYVAKKFRPTQKQQPLNFTFHPRAFNKGMAAGYIYPMPEI